MRGSASRRAGRHGVPGRAWHHDGHAQHPRRRLHARPARTSNLKEGRTDGGPARHGCKKAPPRTCCVGMCGGGPDHDLNRFGEFPPAGRPDGSSSFSGSKIRRLLRYRRRRSARSTSIGSAARAGPPRHRSNQSGRRAPGGGRSPAGGLTRRRLAVSGPAGPAAGARRQTLVGGAGPGMQTIRLPFAGFQIRTVDGFPSRSSFQWESRYAATSNRRIGNG